MLYLSEFRFAGENDEFNFFTAQRRTCYDSYYPFQVFPDKGLRALDFADITILYGGNGSGKTTALNVIAETLRLRRGVPFKLDELLPCLLPAVRRAFFARAAGGKRDFDERRRV